jgi:hypothetical protein
VERLIVCGVQTPNCIRATAFDGIALDYHQVTVLADATASANSAIQEGNLYDMRTVGIDTPTTAEWGAEVAAQAQAWEEEEEEEEDGADGEGEQEVDAFGNEVEDEIEGVVEAAAVDPAGDGEGGE